MDSSEKIKLILDDSQTYDVPLSVIASLFKIEGKYQHQDIIEALRQAPELSSIATIVVIHTSWRLTTILSDCFRYSAREHAFTWIGLVYDGDDDSPVLT